MTRASVSNNPSINPRSRAYVQAFRGYGMKLQSLYIHFVLLLFSKPNKKLKQKQIKKGFGIDGFLI